MRLPAPFVAAAASALLALAPAQAEAQGLPLPGPRPHPLPPPVQAIAASQVKLTIIEGSGLLRRSRQVRLDLRTGVAELWTTSDVYRRVGREEIPAKLLRAIRDALSDAGLKVGPVGPRNLFASAHGKGLGKATKHLPRPTPPEFVLTVTRMGQELSVRGGARELARNPALARAVSLLKGVGKRLVDPPSLQLPPAKPPRFEPPRYEPPRYEKPIAPFPFPRPELEKPIARLPFVPSPTFPHHFPAPLLRWLGERAPLPIPGLGVPPRGVADLVLGQLGQAYAKTWRKRGELAKRMGKLTAEQARSSAFSLGRVLARRALEAAEQLQAAAQRAGESVAPKLGRTAESKGMAGTLRAE
jgi:hypothetical protein